MVIDKPTKITTQEYSRLEKRKITHGIEGKKLHIGCGYLHLNEEGWINIDKSKEVKPDKVIDLKKGLPFPDNTFSHIYSYHVLEHVVPCKWDFVLEEIYRVAKEGCILELGLPFDNVKNRMDYDHYRAFTWHSFDHAEFKNKRNYYKKFIVRRLNKNPPKLIQYFFYLCPLLKDDVYFKFEIVKEKLGGEES